MKFFKSAPLLVLSAWLTGTTALSSNLYAACSSCGESSAAPTPQTQKNIFSGTRPKITRTRIFPNGDAQSGLDATPRNSASGPIFGTNDCSVGGGPMFGPNTCTKRKCGGAMFGPQTCKRLDLPCESCKQPQPTKQPPLIKNYKTVPDNNIYDRIHKCSDLASFQLEWVDFRIKDGRSDSFSRKLGNYRFRLFGCRRFSKNAMLNEGRIIQKNMQFIDIFEDIVNDCYNIVKVPTELCLRDQDYEAPEYILTAEITDYFMNVCDGYDWDAAQKDERRSGSAEMTVTWRLLDLTKTRVLWKGETTGYSELKEGEYNGEMALIEQAFADASLNLKGLPEFENQLAVRVDPETLEQQKTTLLALEQAADPVKCKVPAKTAETCPVPAQINEDGASYGAGAETHSPDAPLQQCTMPAEVIEYAPQETLYKDDDSDTIPLELDLSNKPYPYAENSGSICYGYNNESQNFDFNPNSINGNVSDGGYALSDAGICEPTLNSYLEPAEENACENPLFGTSGEDCDPSLISFIKADQECVSKPLEQTITIPQESGEICLFAADEITSAGGISKDSGYYIPEVEVVNSSDKITQSPEWQPYEQPTEMREPETYEQSGITDGGNAANDRGTEAVPDAIPTTLYNKDAIVTRPTLPQCPPKATEPEYKIEKAPDGQDVKVPTCYIVEKSGDSSEGSAVTDTATIDQTPEIIEKGNYRTADHFCIENVAPYPDMRPENLYKVRASMMSVRNAQGKENAGLLISDDLILTSADLIDNSTIWYDVETINGVKAKAKVVRINVRKNIALLQTQNKMYFRPLSLNMELPPVGSSGYMSLGLLNNAEGENYLDDKGSIKGYRFSDEMGTEIITDTFVQTVSSGGALIDEKGVVTGFASRNQKYDDRGDLFAPIQDAINSVGLEVCGQAEPFVQPPAAVLKPVSSAIDNFTGSKEPAVMSAKKRK